MLSPFTTMEGREQGPGLDVPQATQDGHVGLELRGTFRNSPRGQRAPHGNGGLEK